MKKKVWAGLLSALLCLTLCAPAAPAETRQGVIYLEGQGEIIEETLYLSSQGYSFWYASDRLEAREANAAGSVTVKALYSYDAMTLTLLTKEEADAYGAGGSTGARTQIDVYRQLEKGTIYFLTLIAENGQYLRAAGQYAEEAAEGNAKFFQRVLDSVTFAYNDAAEMLSLLPGSWVHESESSGTVLTLEENGEMTLTCFGASGGYTYTCEGVWSYVSVPNGCGQLTLLFTATSHPLYAGSAYRVECVYEAYTESWVENDTLFTYLIFDPPIRSTGVSPFEDVYGDVEVALHREKGPNMQVVNCKEYVSLRETRSTSSARLEKVPLGALVLAFPEYGQENGFIYCFYHDQEGYILAEYLQAAEGY